MTIPKIIHQIWIQGYQSIPTRLKRYHEECKEINNNYEHMFWNEEKIIDLLRNYFGEKFVETYSTFTVFAQKADFARYAILYVYGGIYLDMDMICKKNLDPFLNYKLFCTTDALHFFYKRYLNGIIGAVPNHSVFLYAFKNIFERLHYRNNVTYSTGTKLFYDSVMEYINMNKTNDVAIIDKKYLHPCGPYDDEDCPNSCDSCFVAHTNYGSWYPTFFKYFYKYFKIKYLYVILLIIFILLIFYTGKASGCS
ncbi:glycosyl transferase [Tupanvirus soda lake]|uniref:Glycosyl transferase n=2 Tax=Tupanvirus TaxID=2094720 RepID=A0A6N1NUJ5_9VIRU|nr:glycosyl transferase [Tupanvirus soda lake]QKU35196.1 glycosyl transferase [Tupanvirus soda lake]